MKCQFPHGDPKSPSFHFCGKPTTENKSNAPYCDDCYNIAYDGKRTAYYNQRTKAPIEYVPNQPKVPAKKKSTAGKMAGKKPPMIHNVPDYKIEVD